MGKENEETEMEAKTEPVAVVTCTNLLPIANFGDLFRIAIKGCNFVRFRCPSM